MLGVGPHGKLQSDANPISVHVVVAGKLHQTAAPIKRELFSIAGESMNAVLQAKTESELVELFLLARYAKASFKVAGIPQDYETPGTTMSFAPQTMRGLFDIGYRGGREGTAWQSLPPGLDSELIAMPRGDTRFATVRGMAPSDSWAPDKIRITLGDGDTANTYSDTAASLSDQGSDRVVPRPRHE